MSNEQRWAVLQKRVFSRYVALKLQDVPAVDTTTLEDVCQPGALTGYMLSQLVARLADVEPPSGKKCPPGASKLRVKQIDSMNNALAFVESQGVTQKVKTSAENVVDGEERPILGLIWAIMSRFEKFGDDDTDLDATASLLMWLRNQTRNFEGITIKDRPFNKSTIDLVLGALIAKNRPSLLEYDELRHSGDSVGNFAKILAAANRYFGLPAYIEPAEVSQLDEKSLVIFCSEFYYGIARQKKLDLAAARIGSLIAWTKVNDALKAEFNEVAERFVQSVGELKKLLADREVDNTLAGAQAKLAAFTEYQQTQKAQLVQDYLKIEALYNKIAMRLADKERPPFQPKQIDMSTLAAEMAQLSDAEKERVQALNEELNRQLKLVELNKAHTTQTEQLATWGADKEAYLSKKEEVTSSAQANFLINVLKAYKVESDAVAASLVPDLTQVGATLAAEKYENQSLVAQRESQVAEMMQKLAQLAEQKMAVLEDDLARELVREATELKHKQFLQALAKLQEVFQQKADVFAARPQSDTVAAALYEIAELANESTDLDNTVDSQDGIDTLAGEILAAAYSGLTHYEFPDKPAVTEAVVSMKTKFTDLKNAAAEKKSVLESDLEREQKREAASLAFASTAQAVATYFVNEAKSVALTTFGYGLLEVEAFAATLDAEDAKVSAQAACKLAEAQAAYDAGEALNFVPQLFTEATMDSLAQEKAALDAAVSERRAKYDAVLADLRRKDGICKAFADVAEPFVAKLASLKEEVTASQADLETQLAQVQEKQAAQSFDAEITAIAEADAAVQAESISYNRHTLLNRNAVEIQRTDYAAFLAAKHDSIAAEIEHAKLRGLTQEQMSEIEEQFVEFDKDNSGSLTDKEFRAALYSIGYDKSKNAIAGIIEEFASAGSMDLEAFKNWAIQEMGAAETKPQITQGFVDINRGESLGDIEISADIFKADDLDFILSTAPQPQDGKYDYTAWVDEIFSR